MEQHTHTWWGWLNHHWAFISLVCFPAFMCYLNSFAIFFKIMGATQLADFLGKLEEALTAAVAAGKAYKQQATKVMIFILVLPFLTGCNTLKTGCGHVTGTEVTIPYVGGKASGNAYGCYMGCLGFNCPKPSTSDMATIMTNYIKEASKDNTIKTVDGGTITYTPASK